MNDEITNYQWLEHVCPNCQKKYYKRELATDNTFNSIHSMGEIPYEMSCRDCRGSG